MSEEFDKEAEREKLREKLADEEEKRSATQHMSELLLQGATMTNQHCDNCGDPLFRDNGETFCPSCANAEAAQAAGPQRPAESTDADTNRGQANAGRNQADADGTAPEIPDDAEVTPLAGDQRGSPQPRAEKTQPRTGTTQPRTERARTQSRTGATDRPHSDTDRPQPPTGDAVGDPRAELQRAVTETARNASAATDPNTARAWLEAAKSAAEALAALER